MSEFVLSKEQIEKLEIAAKRLSEKMPDTNLSALVEEMIDSHYKGVFIAMDVILSVMEGHPEYANLDLLNDMKRYLDGLIVGEEQR